MRPGGALQFSSASIACCIDTPLVSSVASTASKFSTLKSPTKRERNVAAPQLPSKSMSSPFGPAVTREQTIASPRLRRCASEDPCDRAGTAEHHQAGVRDSRRDLAAERIVHIHDRVPQARPPEQMRLGFAVRFQRAVIVQMIASEIGEHGGIESHAVDAILIERMRGNFHAEATHAFVTEFGHLTMHGDAIGRRQRT